MSVSAELNVDKVSELKPGIKINFRYCGGSNPGTFRNATIVETFTCQEYGARISATLDNGEHRNYKFHLMEHITILNIEVIEQLFTETREQLIEKFKEKVEGADGEQLATLTKELLDNVVTAQFDSSSGNLLLGYITTQSLYRFKFDIELTDCYIDVSTDNPEEVESDIENLSFKEFNEKYRDDAGFNSGNFQTDYVSFEKIDE